MIANNAKITEIAKIAQPDENEGLPHRSLMDRRTGTALALSLMLVLAACEGGGPGSEAKAEEEKEDETPPVPVEVVTASLGEISATYSGTASLETDAEATVVARVGGEVEEILVEEGETVENGEVIARLDGDRLRLEAERSRANLEKLRQEYERNKELHARQLVSADAYERLKYDMEALEAAYELARLELSYTDIKAPITGVVSERMIKLGNNITQNTPTFRISGLDPLLAYLHVPERHFNKLVAGQSARVVADALPGSEFEAEVARISPVVDPETGTFKVTVEVVDEAHRLKPGMFTRVYILYDARQNAILIPRDALIEEEEGTYVFVATEDGKAERREIVSGYTSRGQVEVTEGLDAGDEVVTVGQAGLRDTAKLRVVARDGEPVPTAVAEADEEAAADSGAESVEDAEASDD